MIKDTKKRKVMFGNDEYTYSVNSKGEKILSRTEKLGNKDIEVILKGCPDSNSKEVEKFVVDVLSKVYIERHLKKYNNE